MTNTRPSTSNVTDPAITPPATTQPKSRADNSKKDARQQNTPTKTQKVLTLLRRKRGATIDQLVKVTGWQRHSVRGLISGTIKKKLLFNVVAEKDEGSETRYRIIAGKGAK